MAEDESRGTKPILWARLSVNHTKKTMCVALLLPVLLGFVAFRFGGLQFSPPGGGRDFLVRNDVRTEQLDAFTAARDKYELDQDQGERTERSFAREFSLLLRKTKAGSDDPVEVDIDGTGENVLTAEGLAFLKRAEDNIISNKDYERFCYDDESFDCEGNRVKCALPFSITNHPLLYGIYKPGERNPCGRKSSGDPVSAEVFNAFKKTLVNPDSKELNPAFSIFLGKDFSTDNINTQVMRSYVRFGTPIANKTDAKTDREKSEAFDTWADEASKKAGELTDKSYHMYVDSFALFGVRFNPIIFRDLSFSLAAIVAVWIIVFIHTTSPFLASVTIVQVLLGFPFALFIYSIIFRITYFATLQVMTVFLILGIGADDVFVFTDAWKQAPVVLGEGASLEERMSYAYKRAGKAMSVTSFTTAVAFFSTATSPIVPISTFGVFAGLLVLLQFLLVMTIYPSAIIIWHRFWKPKQFWRRCMKERSESEYRPIERFFNGFWTNVTAKLKYPLIAIGAVLIGVSIWLATKLDTPAEAEKFLPDDFGPQKASLLLRDGFPSFDDATNVNVGLVWGLSGIDRSGIGRYNFEDVGEPILDDDFSMRTAGAQQRILDSCSFFSESSRGLITNESSIPEKVNCWIEDFASYRKNILNAGENFQTYSSDKEVASAVLQFLTYETPQGIQPYVRYLRERAIGFDEKKEKIVYAYNDFVSDLKEDDPYSTTWPKYEKWENALEEFNEESVEKGLEGVDEPFQAAGQWTSAILQRALVRNMFQGIAIVMGISLIALTLSTGNIIVAILTLIAIGGILSNVLAFIQLAGWALGIIESIGVVLSVGFSFDYAAHLANAYTESDKSMSKTKRTQAALTELGISILAGAFSTLAASAMLFFAIVIFFTKIGYLIFATIGLALLWSMVFLPALLHTFGPSGKTGEVYQCFGRNKSKDPNADVI